MQSTRYHSSKHIDDTDLIDTGERCPVCGCNAPRVEVGMIQDDPVVHLLSCSGCGACSASHMPVASVIDDYYRGYFSDDGPKMTLGHPNRFAMNLARAIPLAGKSENPIRVLDFGGGDGTLGLMVVERLFCRLSSNQTVEFTLVDYQTPKEYDGDKRICVSHQRNLDDVQGTFDF